MAQEVLIRAASLYVAIVALLGLAAVGRQVVVAPPTPVPTVENPDRAEILRDVGQAVRLVLAAQACAAGDPACVEASRASRPPSKLQRQLAVNARRFVATGTPGFRNDCSGFVSAVLSASGMQTNGDVSLLFDLALQNGALHHEPVPQLGDLVFFDDTHDRNRDGLWNDPLSHIGIVVDVSPEGVVTFAHAGLGAGRALGQLDTRDPDATLIEGERRNTVLRSPKPTDPYGSRYAAGALWVGFATVEEGQDWSGPVTGAATH